MSSPANVKSIAALEELRSALMRFKDEGQKSLEAAEMEIQRTRAWLQERLQYWQNELRRRQRAWEDAQAALEACLAVAESTGLGILACSPLEAAVARARRRVEEAEQELRTVQVHMKRVEEAAISYQRQARQLATMLDSELLKGAEFLRKSVMHLSSYASGSGSIAAGVSTDSGASPVSGGRINSPEGVSTGASNPQRDRIYINCTQCGGSGNEDIECNPCGGTGHRFDGSSCSHCRGLGMKSTRCLHCEGTGTVLEE